MRLPPRIGRHGQIEILLGADAVPTDAPLICASRVSYSPLGIALSDAIARDEIRTLANRMRSAEDGAYVALIESPPAPRPLALVQDNRGTEGTLNFYQRCQTRKDRVWRDFYYRTTYVVLAQIEEHWSSADIELSHPTGHGWPTGLVETVLEALGHFADAPRDTELGLKRVHLSCCLDDLAEPVLQTAVATLNNEQRLTSRPEHRAIVSAEVPIARLGLAEIPGATLLKISVNDRSPEPD
jgi:hypothetical protein